MDSTTTVTIDVIDPEMTQIVDPAVAATQVAAGRQFTEGPVWLASAGEWLFSDIPASALFAWSPAGGLRVFRSPSHKANGNTVDREGRLVTCEHEARRVTRTEPDGSITVLADSYLGRLLNSPNDVVVKRDGTLWFTDPPYGLEGRTKEQDGHYVFRLDPGAHEPVPVASDFSMPNGLCFAPDERALYIADSCGTRHHVRRMTVNADNTLADDGLFAEITPGAPDGMRVDAAGRMFCTAGDGVQVFRPDGTLIGRIRTPRTAANCCLGGPDGRELLITAVSEVWLVPLR
ncbi:MAG: SMP-30/gluconolactonase/LRE family protein [Armatimonadetes bacterium]|nr:SMP-30/gluconolactonase/LRE family protein [Armatimonadota bacterium]